jgi:hypothetical protein
MDYKSSEPGLGNSRRGPKICTIAKRKALAFHGFMQATAKNG